MTKDLLDMLTGMLHEMAETGKPPEADGTFRWVAKTARLSLIEMHSHDPNVFQQQIVRTLEMGLDEEEIRIMASMGLAGEAGETVDAVKKMIFQHHPYDRTRDKVKDELGDVLWYVACLASVFRLSLAEVMAGNIAKLKLRYPDGFDAYRSLNRDKEAEKDAMAAAR